MTALDEHFVTGAIARLREGDVWLTGPADGRWQSYQATVDESASNIVGWFPGHRSLLIERPNASDDSDLVELDLVEGRASFRVTSFRGNGAGNVHDAPSLSPDGTSVAYCAADSLAVLDLGSARGRRISVRGCDFTPVWSPDGSRIVFEHFVQNAYPLGVIGFFEVSIDGSRAKRLGYAPGRARDLALSPEGSSLVFEKKDNYPGPGTAGIYRLDLATGHIHMIAHERQLGDGGKWLAVAPTWSPDGRWLYFSDLRSISERSSTGIAAIEVQTGRIVPVEGAFSA